MRLSFTSALLLAFCSLHPGLLFGQQKPQIPHAQDRPPGPPSTPAEAVKKMKVPPGFSVEVVAAEPDLVNPVSMTFDERGRIWVTESLEYPRSEPGPGRDRIKILEDTDHDGRIDHVTVFAEGLNIPSGIAVGYGGVWVANSPDLLFMRDTDGDGKADTTEVVVTGFGRTDTHELPNSLTWGPDGWLYGLNGVFNYCHVRYPAGSPLEKTRPEGWQFTCAMFRIHPRTREFQIFCEGTSNPWGIAYDNNGSAFVSACVIDHLWHLVESGYYHRQGGPYPPFTWKIESIVKHKHQKAAYCGIHYFDSDAYPEKYREKLYMGNIHGNCLNVDKLARDGSTYFATPEDDFLSANDAWFMPVAQKTGPDGCLYVLDWYDQYHCYQDARRDPAGIERAKGRLYRIRYQDTPRAATFDLTKESDEQLIARLGSPNVFFRDLAQRLLSERASGPTIEKLTKLVQNKSTPRKQRMHALFVLASTDSKDAVLVQSLKSDEDPVFRAWGVRMEFSNPALRQEATRKLIQTDWSKTLIDPSPDVQLQLAIGLGKVEGTEPVFEALLSLLTQSGEDELLPRVIWQNLHPRLERHAAEFLTVIKRRNFLKSPAVASLMPRIVERILGSNLPDPRPAVELFQLVGEGPAPEMQHARLCLAQIAARVQNGEVEGEKLAKLQQELAPIIGKYVKAGATHPLGLDASLLAVSWGDTSGLSYVEQTFTTAGLPPELRLRALKSLIAGKNPSVLDSVPQALTGKAVTRPGSPAASAADFHGQVLAALGRSDDPKVATVILGVYPDLDPEVKPKAIIVLTQRAMWAKELLAAIGAGKIPAEVLGVNEVRKLLASRDAELVKAVESKWGKLREGRNPQREAVIAEMRTVIRNTPGDPHRGQEVFKKVCGQCHKIYGEGQEVGPDITVNGRSSFEQLLSNVFDPSLVIGASYQARTVLTKEGRVVAGLVAEDSDQRVVLKLQGGKQEVIPRADIEEMKTSELSLMPEDVEKTLKPQEIADLFAFITLDKPPSDPTAKQLPGTREIVSREVTEPAQFAALLQEVAPGFTTAAVGEGGLGLVKSHLGRNGVVRTHPIKEGVACVLTRTVDLPAGQKPKLRLSVSHDPRGDWQLLVKANGEKLYDGLVSAKTTQNGWLDLEIDLSKFAGQKTKIELHNFPNNWSWEFGYWGKVEIQP
ncbi:MAG: c-type cytochrome [Planctomycetes bacterium]|nr:c-type cytochrome [Planctomycetota bacterium]